MRLRGWLFMASFIAGSIVAVLLAFPAAVISPAAVAGVTHGWARWHRFSARAILGIRARVEGPRPAGAMLIAAKHQSMFETIEMLLVLDHPVVVMKKELSDIPGWGWVARRYGIIAVDRAGGSATLRAMLRAGRDAIAQGRPILIFPEGTRVPPGDRPPLQSGFSGLYKLLGLPVVPVALDSGRLWPRRGLPRTGGEVLFRFHDAIAAGLPRPQVEARVHAAINSLQD